MSMLGVNQQVIQENNGNDDDDEMIILTEMAEGNDIDFRINIMNSRRNDFSILNSQNKINVYGGINKIEN